LLGRETLEIAPVTLESRVTNFLRLFEFQLSKFRLDPEYLNRFQGSLVEATQAHLAELYNELIAPIRAQLSCRHLVFVPHGLLHYVPSMRFSMGNRTWWTTSLSPTRRAPAFTRCASRGKGIVLALRSCWAFPTRWPPPLPKKYVP